MDQQSLRSLDFRRSSAHSMSQDQFLMGAGEKQQEQRGSLHHVDSRNSSWFTPTSDGSKAAENLLIIPNQMSQRTELPAWSGSEDEDRSFSFRGGSSRSAVLHPSRPLFSFSLVPSLAAFYFVLCFLGSQGLPLPPRTPFPTRSRRTTVRT